MRIITSGRRGGKTYELIQMNAQEGGYIVCRSKQHAATILSMAQEMGVHIPTPITHREFVNNSYYGRGCGHFLIDDVDALLAMMCPIPITVITATGVHHSTQRKTQSQGEY